MSCVVCAEYPSLGIPDDDDYLSLYYRSLTQTHNSTHPSYCQYNTKSQHERHTISPTVHAQLQLNMPGKYPQNQ